MGNPEMIVVFDLLDVGFKNWWFSAFGLIFVGVGFYSVFFPKQAMKQFNQTGNPKFFKVFNRFVFGFSIIWVVTSFTGGYGSYSRLWLAYENGNFEVVEGPVENFVPMPFSGHSNESFTVEGQIFSYSDYGVIPGFNNTHSHGGPIEAGLYVRIYHVDGQIVHLEVERQDNLMPRRE